MASPLIKNLLLQASGSVCVKGISLLLVPLSTRFLMPEDFGLYALYNSFISIVAVFIAVGLRQVFWLEFCRIPQPERRHMLNDMLVIYCCIAIPLLGLLFFYRGWVNSVLFMGHGTSLMLAISLASCFLIFFVELLYQLLIYQQRVGISLMLQALSVAVTVVMALTLLSVGFKVTGMLIAQLMGSMAVSCYGLYQYYAKNIIQSMSFERVCATWRHYLKDGASFVPSLLSMWIISSSTRWILAYYSLAITGIYAVVEMVSTIFQLLFIRPLQTVYAPALFQQFVDAGPCIQVVDRHNKQLMWLTMAVLSLLALLGYWLLSPYALHFLPPAYAAAVPLSLLMAFAQIILVGAAFSICYLQFRKKMLYVSGALLCAALINGLLCWLLVPWLQAAGALIAFLCAVLVYFIFTLWYNQRLHKQS